MGAENEGLPKAGWIVNTSTLPHFPHVLLQRTKCPFCAGSYELLATQEGDQQALLHTTPMCETYHRLSIEDFLEALKKTRS